jgi:hypothetical protein
MIEKPSSDTDITEPFLVLLIKGKEVGGLNTLYDLRLVNPTSSILTNVCTIPEAFTAMTTVSSTRRERPSIQRPCARCVYHNRGN